MRHQRLAVDPQDELGAHRAAEATAAGGDRRLLDAWMTLGDAYDLFADAAELVVVVAEHVDAGIVARAVVQAAAVVGVLITRRHTDHLVLDEQWIRGGLDLVRKGNDEAGAVAGNIHRELDALRVRKTQRVLLEGQHLFFDARRLRARGQRQPDV